MIRLSGKHLLVTPRAFALICPETSERPENEVFGFADSLADQLLSWKGWMKQYQSVDEFEKELFAIKQADPTFDTDLQRKRIRTQDEITACVQALLDPKIDVWGYRLVEAQHRVVRAAAWLLETETLLPYFEGDSAIARQIRTKRPGVMDEAFYDAEQAFRSWFEHHPLELGIRHILLDAMVEYDRDLDAPNLLDQIHRQMDEEG